MQVELHPVNISQVHSHSFPSTPPQKSAMIQFLPAGLQSRVRWGCKGLSVAHLNFSYFTTVGAPGVRDWSMTQTLGAPTSGILCSPDHLGCVVLRNQATMSEGTLPSPQVQVTAGQSQLVVMGKLDKFYEHTPSRAQSLSCLSHQSAWDILHQILPPASRASAKAISLHLSFLCPVCMDAISLFSPSAVLSDDYVSCLFQESAWFFYVAIIVHFLRCYFYCYYFLLFSLSSVYPFSFLNFQLNAKLIYVQYVLHSSAF